MSTDATVAAPESRLLVGMGGSGIKTLAKFASVLAQHREEAASSELFMAYLLVDTDGGDLRQYERQIRETYSYVHHTPIVHTVHLSADITDFSAFVASRMHKAGHHDRLKEAWWYRTDRDNEPFTATTLRASPTKGAGQCPLVSTFLAWHQMPEIERSIERLLDELKGKATKGANVQNWTLDVAVIAGLAGGTGRGCWHLVASKVREALRNLNRRPKPVGFFFDATTYQHDVMNGSAAQATKMRVNSITGVSELVGWMRNEFERNDDVPRVGFRLPSLERPDDESADFIDAARMTSNVRGEELSNVTGFAPISDAFLIFASGKQGTLGDSTAYHQAVANALYARMFSTIGGQDINESSGLGGLGAATVSVPIAGIKRYVHEYVREFLPRQYAQSADKADVKLIVDSAVGWLDVPEVVPKKADIAADNVVQRIYYAVRSRLSAQMKNLTEHLTEREFEDAESACKQLAAWADSPDGTSHIVASAMQEVIERLWGHQASPDVGTSDGLLRNMGVVDRLDHDDFYRIFGGNPKIAKINPLAEGLRRLLQRSELTLKVGPRDAEKIQRVPLDGYGTKQAVAAALVLRLRDIADNLSARVSDSVAQGQSGSESPVAVLERARQGLFSGAVTEKERRDILMATEAWVLVKATKHVRDSLRRTLLEAAEVVQSLALAYKTAVDSLAEIADSRKADLLRSRDNHFWNENDFNALLDPRRSVFDKKILSAQELQAVASDGTLEEELRKQMKDHAIVGFEEARRDFEASLRDWVDAHSHAANSIEGRSDRLKDLIHDGVEQMADQFMLPPDFYERHFGFFETVRELIASWGRKMLERAGSPQDISKLRQAFDIQFGLPYPDSMGGQPKQMTESELRTFAEEACTQMAVRLGGRCDPLFEQRFDEGERPRYDRVIVVLPTEEIFDDQFAEKVNAAATGNQQFAIGGVFKACPTYKRFDTGNPYMMIGYATQYFADWERDDGINRIASLGYFQDADTMRWLKACEDPNGASVFLDVENFELPHSRSTYGLGFISPIFVRNPHLRERRWSPWDDSKARSADKKNERLDLLAYALLDEPPIDKAKHMLAVHQKAEWSLPLMSLGDGTTEGSASAWHFTRPAVRKCTEVAATKDREANHPAFGAGQGYQSIRKCFDELMENEGLAAAIAGEADIYMTEVLANDEFADDFAPEVDIRLLFQYLIERLGNAKKQATGPAAAKTQAFIDELVERVRELQGMKLADLCKRFRSLKTNCELHSRA